MSPAVSLLHSQSPAKVGAALLDRCVPNWFTRINVDKFTISSGCHCALGQLYGSVEQGWPLLSANISRDSRFDARQALIDYGFAVSTIGGYDKNLEKLDNEWLAELNQRMPGILSEKALYY